MIVSRALVLRKDGMVGGRTGIRKRFDIICAVLVRVLAQRKAGPVQFWIHNMAPFSNCALKLRTLM